MYPPWLVEIRVFADFTGEPLPPWEYVIGARVSGRVEVGLIYRWACWVRVGAGLVSM